MNRQLIVAAFLLTATAASAQLAWRRPATFESVNGRAVAFDSSRNRLVAFGGERSWDQNNETWEWDGSSWRRLEIAGPSARYDARMAYDAARRMVVLYGGTYTRYTGGHVIWSNLLNDLWEFDGSVWREVRIAGPSVYLSSLVYHSASQKMVLYGTDNRTVQQTWEYDGTSWRQYTGGQPTAIAQFAIAEDAARGRLVLFGGHARGAPRPEL